MQSSRPSTSPKPILKLKTPHVCLDDDKNRFDSARNMPNGRRSSVDGKDDMDIVAMDIHELPEDYVGGRDCTCMMHGTGTVCHLTYRSHLAIWWHHLTYRSRLAIWWLGVDRASTVETTWTPSPWISPSFRRITWAAAIVHA